MVSSAANERGSSGGNTTELSDCKSSELRLLGSTGSTSAAAGSVLYRVEPTNTSAGTAEPSGLANGTAKSRGRSSTGPAAAEVGKLSCGNPRNDGARTPTVGSLIANWALRKRCGSTTRQLTSPVTRRAPSAV